MYHQALTNCTDVEKTRERRERAGNDKARETERVKAREERAKKWKKKKKKKRRGEFWGQEMNGV